MFQSPFVCLFLSAHLTICHRLYVFPSLLCPQPTRLSPVIVLTLPTCWAQNTSLPLASHNKHFSPTSLRGLPHIKASCLFCKQWRVLLLSLLTFLPWSHFFCLLAYFCCSFNLFDRRVPYSLYIDKHVVAFLTSEKLQPLFLLCLSSWPLLLLKRHSLRFP